MNDRITVVEIEALEEIRHELIMERHSERTSKKIIDNKIKFIDELLFPNRTDEELEEVKQKYLTLLSEKYDVIAVDGDSHSTEFKTI
jgi:hypothetical protein